MVSSILVEFSSHQPPKRGRDEDTKPPALDKKPRLNSDDKKALDGGDGGKKTKSAAWTKEQVRQLWKALDVRPVRQTS